MILKMKVGTHFKINQPNFSHKDETVGSDRLMS